MEKFTQAVKDFWNDEEGLTAVEYAVAGGLIAATVVAGFKTLGGTVSGIITGINAELIK
ncbi:Flp family type IVb pilin [Vibrio alfacsensis]|uniref:Flp family type IVb pilin n=1 Tax=Vibrio alfacsensis TaxID=1074311 RepID=UPI0040695674